MIAPGWALNPTSWLIVGALCLLVEIVIPRLFFLGFGIAGAIVAALVWRFDDAFASAGNPFLTTALAFVVIGLVLWAVFRLIARMRHPIAARRSPDEH